MYIPNIFFSTYTVKLKLNFHKNHIKEIPERPGTLNADIKKKLHVYVVVVKDIDCYPVKCITEHIKFKPVPNYIFQRKKWHTLEYKPKIPCNQSFSLDLQQYLKMLMMSGSSRTRPTRQSMPIPTPPMATALGRASYTLIRLRV